VRVSIDVTARTLRCSRGSHDSRLPKRTAISEDSTRTEKAEPSETARHLAMLEQSEELAGIGSWDWEVSSGRLLWSDNLFRLFGLAPGEIMPSVDYVVGRIHVDDRERVRGLLEGTAATGQLEPLEYRIVRRGGVRLLRAKVAEIQQQGRVTRLVGYVQDITEGRRIARELAGHLAIDDMIARWVSLEESGEQLLAALGEAMDFAAGVLTLHRDGDLHPHSWWSSPAGSADALASFTRPLGEGQRRALAVEAWLARQPVTVVDLAEAPPFRGRDAALGAGLKSAIGLPAVFADHSLLVLEFYSRETIEPTETLLRTLSGMSHELGYFFALRRAELRPQELTPREREVLQLTAQGHSVKVVAARLSVSTSTVKTHFEHIYSKWSVSDRASAVAKGLRDGVIQ
jgi:PAS domain S-box-containing protein